ncbi:MAG: DUF4097 family beta strand repeat protein [Erysipelotrichaceae bacterium]|nr:DUF4097 family beta strand repeat protein [Erysipelotrichaceae bacterium]
MKKRKNSVYILIAILLAAIVGIYLAYDKLYYPSARTYATYLAVHQEMEEKDADSIHISSFNHKVIVKPSDDDKIKVIYYQKSENANVLVMDGRKFELTMVERVENLDNILFKSDKKIDTIIVYLPADKAYSLNVESVDGSLSVEGVSLSQLIFENAYGDVTVRNCELGKAALTISYGNVVLSDNSFKSLSASSVSGNITLDLSEQLSAYSVSASSTYGSLLLNGEQIIYVDEEGNEKVSNQLITQEDHKLPSVLISSTRAKVSVNTVEPQPEPDNPETEQPAGE